jgi:hypothetical protein
MFMFLLQRVLLLKKYIVLCSGKSVDVVVVNNVTCRTKRIDESRYTPDSAILSFLRI